MELPQRYADAILQHALTDDPNECCGILSGRGGIIMGHHQIVNTEASPYRYNMDARELFQAVQDAEMQGWEFIAFYHSHTHSEAYPSATDVRLAQNWPDPFYLLISLADKGNPVIRAFEIVDGEVTEEPILFT